MRISYFAVIFLILSFSLFPAEQEDSWSPGSPDRRSVLSSDWVKLENGEWLVGSFLSLRDGYLFFDSDEFGELSLKWQDLKELHTEGKVVLVLLDGRVLTSRVSVFPDSILLKDVQKSGGEEIARDSVISMVPASGKWWELWKGRISAGVNLRKGNTDQFDFQMLAESVLRTAFNRFNFSYAGNFSKAQGVSISGSNNARVSWNYFINHRMYIIPIAYDFLSDPFKNIRQQHTPSAGFGYGIFNRPSFEWDVLGGAGYRYLEYSSVESGQKPFSQSVVLQVGTKITADINDRTELNFNYNVNFDLINLKNIVQSLSTRIFVDITNNLELDVMFTWDRVGDPEKREDGSLPEKDDFNLSSGVSFSF